MTGQSDDSRCESRPRAKGRSLAEFGRLSPTEERLVKACASGDVARGEANRPEQESPENRVRADLVRFLSLGGDEFTPVHEKGVQLEGAWIVGDLDLIACRLRRGLRLTSCNIDGIVLLIDAELVNLSLEGCKVRRIFGDRARCRGSIFLSEKFHATGLGDVPEALRSFKWAATVRFPTARIGGNLYFWDARIEGIDFEEMGRFAIFLDNGAAVEGNVYFGKGSQVTGIVNLVGINVHGDLRCNGGRFEFGGENALQCRGAKIGGNVLLNEEFHCAGSVVFDTATIGGNLDCTGGQFVPVEPDVKRAVPTPRNPVSVSFENSQIGGTVFLRKGFHAARQVRLRGATIGGGLDCSGGHISGAEQNALAIGRAQIGGDVDLNMKFHAGQEVDLVGAKIGGNLDCVDGTFDGSVVMIHGQEKLVAINCDRAEINGDVYFCRAFRAKGEVRLSGARIRGSVNCEEGSFRNPGKVAFYAEGVDIVGTFRFRKVSHVTGEISLMGAHVRTIWDDLESYENASAVILDGFRYDRVIGDAPTNAEEVIAWLQKQPRRDLMDEFKPQPWEQVTKLLREMGHGEDAKEIAIQKQLKLREAGKIPRGARTLHWIFGLLVGYGYRPLRLFYFVLGVWLVCSLWFWFAAMQGIMAPTNPRVYEDTKYEMCRPENLGNWTTCEKAPLEYTTFNSAIYSLGLILPLVSLQQEKDWAPLMMQPCIRSTAILVWDFCSVPSSRNWGGAVKPAYWPLGVATWVLSWLEVLFGWVAGLLFAAVLSGLVRQE